MWKALMLVLMVSCAFLSSSCDNYKYDGMTGSEALAKSRGMNLENAYNFYVDTYTKTNPPMLDVAGTFERFGHRGADYVAARALKADKAGEFEAGMSALLLLDYRCSIFQKKSLYEAGLKLKVRREFVSRACGAELRELR